MARFLFSRLWLLLQRECRIRLRSLGWKVSSVPHTAERNQTCIQQLSSPELKSHTDIRLVKPKDIFDGRPAVHLRLHFIVEARLAFAISPQHRHEFHSIRINILARSRLELNSQKTQHQRPSGLPSRSPVMRKETNIVIPRQRTLRRVPNGHIARIDPLPVREAAFRTPLLRQGCKYVNECEGKYIQNWLHVCSRATCYSSIQSRSHEGKDRESDGRYSECGVEVFGVEVDI